MSVEQVNNFRDGIAHFSCNGVTFSTLMSNYEQAVNDLEVGNDEFKSQLIQDTKSFIHENIKDYVEHGRITSGNFTEWLEEEAADVIQVNNAGGNNGSELWDLHFAPLVDIYDSLIECVDNYYNTEWAANNNNNNAAGGGRRNMRGNRRNKRSTRNRRNRSNSRRNMRRNSRRNMRR
jgi:hypothetical protein